MFPSGDSEEVFRSMSFQGPLQHFQVNILDCAGTRLFVPGALISSSSSPLQHAALAHIYWSQGYPNQDYELVIQGGVGTCIFIQGTDIILGPFQCFEVVIQCSFGTCQFIPKTLMVTYWLNWRRTEVITNITRALQLDLAREENLDNKTAFAMIEIEIYLFNIPDRDLLKLWRGQ